MGKFLAGVDHVTMIGHECTVARATGRVFETPWVHVWQLPGGEPALRLAGRSRRR